MLHVRSLPLVLALLALRFAGEAPASALRAGTTFYVAPGGNDEGPGLLASPWRTIGKAAAALSPGDTVLIREGTYAERVVVTRSGARDAEIVFAAYPGESPVIDGTTVQLPDALAGLFEIAQAGFIRVRGLRLTHAGPGTEHAGILLDGAHDVVLEENSTYDTASSGIGVWSSRNVTIARNVIELACNGGQQECLTVAGTVGFDVVENRVHGAVGGELGGEGICPKDGSRHGRIRTNEVWGLARRPGILVSAWDKHTFDLEVDGNVVHDLEAADGISLASEMGGLLENVRVTNNVVVRCGHRGVVVGGYGDTPSLPMKDLLIVNNTFAGNGTSGWGGGIAIDNPEASGVVIRNNVVSGNASFQIVVATTVPASHVAIDHNLIDGFRGEEGETRGSAFVEGDPLFLDPLNDLRLAAASPAIDRGLPAGAPVADLNGRLRPLGAGVDLGAFERPATATSVTHFVPVVLRSEGKNGAYFTSELTLTNRGDGNAAVRYDFVGTMAGTSGTATEMLGAKRQVVIPDAIARLRGLQIPIPGTGNVVGTLRVTFSSLASPADASVLVRTTTPVPPAAPTGAAGLSYAGVPLARLPRGPVVLCGLRADVADRSNVAVQNAGGTGDGDATLRVSLVSGWTEEGATVLVEEKTLAPGGFYQMAVPAGFFGCARVERIAGAAPYYAYGVVNDNANSDGSFLLPEPESSLGGWNGVTLPVAVETAVFSTELTLANTSAAPMRVRVGLHAAGIGATPAEALFDLAPGAQRTFPGVAEWLRSTGASVPSPVVGPLTVTRDGGETEGLFVGARTGNAGGGGRYATAYAATAAGKGREAPAFLPGLQQTATTRTNLAIVNLGEVDGSESSFRIELWNGGTGAKVAETTVVVAVRRQLQLNAVLAEHAPGTTQGWAVVTRLTGTNPYLAYVVLNDGGAPGEASGDGAYVPAP